MLVVVRIGFAVGVVRREMGFYVFSLILPLGFIHGAGGFSSAGFEMRRFFAWLLIYGRTPSPSSRKRKRGWFSGLLISIWR